MVSASSVLQCVRLTRLARRPCVGPALEFSPELPGDNEEVHTQSGFDGLSRHASRDEFVEHRLAKDVAAPAFPDDRSPSQNCHRIAPLRVVPHDTCTCVS